MDSIKRMKRANFLLVWASALMNYLVLHYGLKYGVAICIFWDTYALNLMLRRFSFSTLRYKMPENMRYVFEWVHDHDVISATWCCALLDYVVLEYFGYSEVSCISCIFIDAMIVWGRRHTYPLYNFFKRILYGSYDDWR